MYILDLVKLQLEHARAGWRDAQPKVKEDDGDAFNRSPSSAGHLLK